ncbi:hypothetical protein F4679DRAFT_528693 [Xylaria curta]|nr:hypothetical protein F4679DRAFT_528693 [Xylaria curta]
MTMAKSEERYIEDQGDLLYLQITIENEGWSSLKPLLSLSSSRSSRNYFLRPLPPLLCAITTAEIDAPYDVESDISKSTFDLGLGCFGHLSQVTDYRLAEIEKELIHGNHICSDESWIGFRPEDSGDDEDCYTHSFDEAGCHPASHVSGGQDLLKELDDLEAARPKPEKRQAVIPGNREGIWEKLELGASELHFDFWVDEIAALEASASMPKGTRYYKVKDVGDCHIAARSSI